MLILRNLHCERNEQVLFSRLSLSIVPGMLLHVAGGNGTGKTTLLRMLARLNKTFEGEISFQQPEVSSRLLFIGHESGIKLALTPLENLRWWVALYGSYSKKACVRALAQTGLYEEMDVPCGRLSAGQRQRVALARLWLSDTLIWLLDEPFTALDVEAVDVIAMQILAHIERKGIVVLTTHQVPVRLKPFMQEIYLGDYKDNIAVHEEMM